MRELNGEGASRFNDFLQLPSLENQVDRGGAYIANSIITI